MRIGTHITYDNFFYQGCSTMKCSILAGILGALVVLLALAIGGFLAYRCRRSNSSLSTETEVVMSVPFLVNEERPNPVESPDPEEDCNTTVDDTPVSITSRGEATSLQRN